MIMSPFSKLIRDFIESDISKKYVGYVDEPMAVFTAIFAMNDFMKVHFDNVNEAYTDKEAVENFYLHYLPSEYFAFPAEVLIIHELILDLYQFMVIHKYISRQEYLEMLRLFQADKPPFLKRMIDERYWSKEKRKVLTEVEEYTHEDFFAEEHVPDDQNFKQLTSSIEKFNERMDKSLQQKILPFPGKATAVKSACIFQLRIDLKGFKPPVWRRVLIGDDSTFAQLHQVIQNVFEWENSHVYFFKMEGALIQPDFGIHEHHTKFGSCKDSESTYTKEIFADSPTIDYIYDFKRKWRHIIKVEDIIPCENLSQKFKQVTSNELPICVKGKGNAPNEENDPTFTDFDLEAINGKLKHLRDKH